MTEIVVGVVATIGIVILVVRMVTKTPKSVIVKDGHPEDLRRRLKDKDADG